MIKVSTQLMELILMRITKQTQAICKKKTSPTERLLKIMISKHFYKRVRVYQFRPCYLL